MRAWLCAFLLVCACQEDTITVVPPTSIMLRIQATSAVREAGQKLIVRIARKEGAKWRNRAPYELAYDRIHVWPTDLPVIPEGIDDGKHPVEFVVDAIDVEGNALAQARAITYFQPQEQRLLELVLEPCGDMELGEICETRTDCHGTSCKTCIDGACASTPQFRLDYSSDFDPVAPIQGIDAGPAASDDTYRHADAEVENVEPDAEPDAEPECETNAVRCTDKTVETCNAGAWSAHQECQYSCRDGGCVGECEPATLRCSSDDALVPELCGDDGQWRLNTVEAPSGVCAYLCEKGLCTGECRPAMDMRCSPRNDRLSQRCGSDASWVDERLCPELCSRGGCARLVSCVPQDASLPGRDSLACSDNASCCESLSVPGGSFLRSYDKVTEDVPTFSATLSPFRLDRFEVTVSRFRRWIAVYDSPDSRPSPGAGKNPNNPLDPGWDERWTEKLPANAQALRARVSGRDDGTWTDVVGENEKLPINYVDWYVAFAFCVWDGGRLPTEAEWNFAAAGGEQQRVYPWSDPPSSDALEAKHAVLEGATAPMFVGSKVDGDGRWGHSDLTGNLLEWVVDAGRFPYATDRCDDCADFDFAWCRVYRGGAYGYLPGSSTASYRDCVEPEPGWERSGFRCARGI